MVIKMLSLKNFLALVWNLSGIQHTSLLQLISSTDLKYQQEKALLQCAGATWTLINKKVNKRPSQSKIKILRTTSCKQTVPSTGLTYSSITSSIRTTSPQSKEVKWGAQVKNRVLNTQKTENCQQGLNTSQLQSTSKEMSHMFDFSKGRQSGEKS